jgi:16S rRNA (cytosine1402-N4)-methyltransferase
MRVAREITMLEHLPVMLNEVIQGLDIKPDGFYVDATFGRGGHSSAILSQLSSQGRLLVMDKDPDAIEHAALLYSTDHRVIIRQESFKNADKICAALKVLGKVDGFLMDLGVSSPQLDNQGRGFSFNHEGPLDMRMDPTQGISAKEWLSLAKEAEIAEVLKTYGEERYHKKIANAIVTARDIAPILSTTQLAQIIAKAHPAWEKFKHPATRSFQAIRIFINDELGALTTCLNNILEILAPKGRLAVLSFHSLEDRMVKQFIQNAVRGDDYPRGLPILYSDLNPKLKWVVRKQKATDAEVFDNRRARSATLRIAEKLETR